jgi:hypothetical protein
VAGLQRARLLIREQASELVRCYHELFVIAMHSGVRLRTRAGLSHSRRCQDMWLCAFAAISASKLADSFGGECAACFRTRSRGPSAPTAQRTRRCKGLRSALSSTSRSSWDAPLCSRLGAAAAEQCVLTLARP